MKKVIAYTLIVIGNILGLVIGIIVVVGAINNALAGTLNLWWANTWQTFVIFISVALLVGSIGLFIKDRTEVRHDKHTAT